MSRVERARELHASNLERMGYPLAAKAIRDPKDRDPFHETSVLTIAEFAQSEVETADRESEEWFWSAVDRGGLTGLPSDMGMALGMLVSDRADLQRMSAPVTKGEIVALTERVLKRRGRVLGIMSHGEIALAAHMIMLTLMEVVENGRPSAEEIEAARVRSEAQ